MEILGIGINELIFIIIIALIVLGPKDMQKTGKTIGKWLNNLINSDGWKVFQKTSNEIRSLPRNLMREANTEIEKIKKDINPASSLTSNRPPNLKSGRQPQPYSPTPIENKISPVESEPEQNESGTSENA